MQQRKEPYTEAVNKQQQLWTGAAAAIVLVGVLYVMWPTASEAPTTEVPTVNNQKQAQDYVKAPSAPPKTSAAPTVSASPRAGSYAPYTADKAVVTKTHAVVLFFNSASCAGCKVLDTDIRSHLSAIPKDLTILEVNYDTNTELKQKFGVQTPHILVQLDAWGGRMTQWGSSQTLSDIVTRMVRF